MNLKMKITIIATAKVAIPIFKSNPKTFLWDETGGLGKGDSDKDEACEGGDGGEGGVEEDSLFICGDSKEEFRLLGEGDVWGISDDDGWEEGVFVGLKTTFSSI